jgi:1,4-alpha-glucan branching enzyme
MLEQRFGTMIRENLKITTMNDDQKVLIYEKGLLLFIFNFHPSNSLPDYEVGTSWSSDHIILLSSNTTISNSKWIPSMPRETSGRPNCLTVSIPSRSCMILCSKDEA